MRIRLVSVALLAVTVLLWTAASAWAVTLYSVRPKDTLDRIARRHGVSSERVLQVNPELRQRTGLKVGQILVIPDPGEARLDEHDPALRSNHSLAMQPTTPDVNSTSPPTAPAPAPTPISAETADQVNGEPGVENIGTVNKRAIEVALSGETYRHAPLSSRRGRLLSQITRMARRFMGVPYVWGGTTGRGYDCSGFTMRMYQLAGIPIKRLADEQFYQGSPTGRPQAGDLVFFTTYLPGPSHCGIYLGNDLFIHASSSKGVTVSSLNDTYYKKRYLGARKFF